jgi:hypothetical protein
MYTVVDKQFNDIDTAIEYLLENYTSKKIKIDGILDENGKKITNINCSCVIKCPDNCLHVKYDSEYSPCYCHDTCMCKCGCNMLAFSSYSCVICNTVDIICNRCSFTFDSDNDICIDCLKKFEIHECLCTICYDSFYCNVDTDYCTVCVTKLSLIMKEYNKTED